MFKTSKDPAALDIQYVKGVGPKRAALLAKIGIKTVMDAFLHLPYRYEDRGEVKKIVDLSVFPKPARMPTLLGEATAQEAAQIQTVSGDVISMRLKRISGGRAIFEIAVSDGSGVLSALWFNQPYLADKFSVGDRLVLSGTIRPSRRGAGLSMENPEFEILQDGDVPSAGIAPIYRLTEGLGQRQTRDIISGAVLAYGEGLKDPVPEEITKRLGLPPFASAVRDCHIPGEHARAAELNSWLSPAQKRLAFDELFMLELGLAIMRRSRVRAKGISFSSKGELGGRLIKALPFSLTSAQVRAVAEILKDMQSPHPMNRLLQGDVGSGKTVVAAIAMLRAVECGYQSALMAPTEILAGQHFINLRAMMAGVGVNACLLTSGVRNRPEDEISSGKAHVVVGTHALLEEGVKFRKLGLIVIDEQHRFGVRQRAVIKKKGENPDVLTMTATPIPRTLAMTLYGDLDCSVMDSLPPGRSPVETTAMRADEKRPLYEMILGEIRAGGQVYVVYPLIEESDKSDLKSAVMGEEAFKNIFPKARVALMHGRMKPDEREKTMMDFKRGGIDILVSTTVIEVGVDVPNASLMVIVHAERFGLSQLHQLRGRVGRGKRKSRCVLLYYDNPGEEAARRLNIMAATSDGFRIAEEDLAIRGPGEMAGTRQSGMPELRLADIIRDARLLGAARDEAFALVEADPGLEVYTALRHRLEEFWKGKAELFGTA